MCYAQVAPPGRACGQRQPQGLRSSECGKRSRKLGLQGEGEEREQKSHLDRVEQNKTKTRMRSCLGSGSRRLGVQSPLAGHLLPLLLVPADFGRVQLLRGQGGGGGSCAALPATHPGLVPSKTELQGNLAAGALVTPWAGTGHRKELLQDVPGPQPKAAPGLLLAHTWRSTSKITVILSLLQYRLSPQDRTGGAQAIHVPSCCSQGQAWGPAPEPGPAPLRSRP